MIKFTKIIITLALIIFLAYSQVSAEVKTPNFPSCLNSQGTVIANFSSGTHGVPGNTSTFQGADTVFSLTDGNILQCLCTVNGEGIQTNWWRFSVLDADQISELKLQGWVHVPDGSAWGLDPVPYLAMNSNYSCRAIGGVSNSGGSGNGNSSSGGSGSNSGNNVSLGEILGLAATGNIRTIYGLVIIGFFSFGLGVFLQGKKN